MVVHCEGTYREQQYCENGDSPVVPEASHDEVDQRACHYVRKQHHFSSHQDGGAHAIEAVSDPGVHRDLDPAHRRVVVPIRVVCQVPGVDQGPSLIDVGTFVVVDASRVALEVPAADERNDRE